MTGVRLRHARRLATEACRMQVAKGKALPVAFILETSNHLMKHGGIKARSVAVYQASEGALLEVPSRLPEGLEHMTRMMDRCA